MAVAFNGDISNRAHDFPLIS